MNRVDSIGVVIVGVVVTGAVVAALVASSGSDPEIIVGPEPSQMTSAEYTASLIEYLQKSDPDEWHKIARGWNWDGGVGPLSWLIRQPQCDRGTALLIYWKGGPGFLKQYGTREEVPGFISVEQYDLSKEVEGRLLSGFYGRHDIAFNPRDHEDYDWTTRHDEASEKIPQQLFDATSGRDIRESCVYKVSGSTGHVACYR